jgi:hypothetical protein
MIARMVYLIVAIGGWWFIGLMHGYAAGTHDFIPHGEMLCTCVELGCIPLMAWAAAKDVTEPPPPRPSV